ncbi:MAG: right-handed parallel beta-helix repeat-containing protein [Acidobacteriota bacterium]|nr:right-handed parallel beta-helix repeat-containing protein [Acidobacteriota bacterium]
MFTSNLVRNAMLSLITLSCFIIAASAQSSRVFVSAASGVDAGACTLAQPCRTFTYSLTQVNAKGEVVAVDSGEYDQVTINKAVTIQTAPGVYAGITVTTGTSAVRIIAGASDRVILRGLTLHAFGGQAGQSGIYITAGGTLHVENCVINGFSLSGISVNNISEVFIKDTTVRDSGYAVLVSNNAALIKAVVENCRIENSIIGVHASSNARVVVRGSVASGQSSVGFLASPVGGTSAELTLENCLSSHNSIGVTSCGNSIVRVSNSTITQNTTGLSHTGTLLTRGNNTVEANSSGNGTFTGSFSAQ